MRWYEKQSDAWALTCAHKFAVHRTIPGPGLYHRNRPGWGPVGESMNLSTFNFNAADAENVPFYLSKIYDFR